MQHEKILRRDDGSRVKIVVRLVCDHFSNHPQWYFYCHHCAPGKRTWTNPSSSHTERIADERKRSLLLASEEEIKEAMRELLLKIVPTV